MQKAMIFAEKLRDVRLGSRTLACALSLMSICSSAQSFTVHSGESAQTYRMSSVDSISFDPTTDAQLLGDTVAFDVSTFGVKGDGQTDDLPKLTKVFERACSMKNRPTKIIFRKDGIYRLGQHLTDLYGRIPIFNAQNLMVEGNGCTILGHPSGRIFALYRSENITLRNFHIDYSPLPYTQGHVTKAVPSSYYLEFQVEDGYPEPAVGDESYYIPGNKMIDCITANADTRKFYQGHSTINKVVSIGDGVYGVYYGTRDQSQLKVGDFFCMKITYEDAPLERALDQSIPEQYGEYKFSSGGNITVKQCKNVTLDGIISHAAPLMTFTMQETTKPIIRNCRVEAIGDRIVAGCSDGVHLNGNESQPLIENCYFERTMDDAIHMKISGDKITEVQAQNKIRIAHSDIVWNNTSLGVGKTVMIYDADNANQLAMCKITAYEPLNCREGICTLDQNVEGMQAGHFAYLQANEDEEATIRNCSFGTQLQRAILTHQPTLVSGCTIEDNGLGFDVQLMSGGIEGPPTQRLTIENTRFLNLSWGGVQVVCPSKDYDQKGTPQLIIRGCTFDLQNDVPCVTVTNSNGLSFTNNTVYKSYAMPQSNLIKRTNTSMMEQTGNNFWSKLRMN